MLWNQPYPKPKQSQKKARRRLDTLKMCHSSPACGFEPQTPALVSLVSSMPRHGHLVRPALPAQAQRVWGLRYNNNNNKNNDNNNNRHNNNNNNNNTNNNNNCNSNNNNNNPGVSHVFCGIVHAFAMPSFMNVFGLAA